MNFDEFVRVYNGKATDYDGGCGVQCVDLAKLYMDKVLGIRIGAIGNAEAYWRRYNELSILNKNFDRIANTPEFIPHKGDIVVWDLRHGKYGHIAIADGVGTTSYFYSYDQNWGGKAMKRVKHTYRDGFAGVLRPKGKINLSSNITNYEAGQAVEINVPMFFTGAVEGDRFQYDNKTEICWVHADTKSLIEKDNLRARAVICFVQSDCVGVQVFGDQFLVKMGEIVRKLD